ncbi:MAG: ribose-phosphate pyrophosphokinase [Candidatus Levybacteria bacterium]|nr:ribose-phosphate pyrophosphokinase [Candidatus Levybacteria bacterium]
MKIFSGSSNKPLAQKLADKLQISLSPLEIHIFADGERRVRILDKVIDEDCVIVQSCSSPVDTNYMELFFIADGLKRSGAKSVTAVIPYLGYQRQDHIFRDGEAVSLEVIVKTLEAVGINRVIVFDLHSVRIEQAFHIPLVHLSGLPLFAETIKRIVPHGSATILVSPDMGGIRRIKLLSGMLNNLSYAAIEKNRDLETGEVEMVGAQGLDNKYKTAIIVDDMISSGGTIAGASDFLKEKGIKEVFVFATHAIFSDDAPQILSKNELIKKVYVTDAVYVPKEKQFEKLDILSIAHLTAGNL